MEWAQLLAPQGRMTVRGTPYDGVFIGLWLNAYDGRDIVHSGFDGAYTYFASGESLEAAFSRSWLGAVPCACGCCACPHVFPA